MSTLLSHAQSLNSEPQRLAISMAIARHPELIPWLAVASHHIYDAYIRDERDFMKAGVRPPADRRVFSYAAERALFGNADKYVPTEILWGRWAESGGGTLPMLTASQILELFRQESVLRDALAHPDAWVRERAAVLLIPEVRETGGRELRSRKRKRHRGPKVR